MHVCDHAGTTTEDIYSACKDGDELYVKQWANHPENDINSTLVMVDLLYTVPTAARYVPTSPFYHHRYLVLFLQGSTWVHSSALCLHAWTDEHH